MHCTTRPAAAGNGRPAWFPARLPAALLLLALAATQVQAQWVWRDKDGRMNASDRPPPREVADKDIVSRPPSEARRTQAAAAAATASAASDAAPASTVPGSQPLAAPAQPTGASAPRGPLDREVEARRRAAEQEQAARARAEEERLAAQRAENCRRARSHAAALETGQRIARFNDKGEREVLDDRGRAEEMRQARAAIASDCR